MDPGRTLRIAAFVTAAGFAGVACGASSDSADDATAIPGASDVAQETEPEAPAEPGDISAGPSPSGDVPEILQFTSTLVGGGELDAAGLSGTPTAFWFWSPT